MSETRFVNWYNITDTDGRFDYKNRAIFSTETPDLKKLIGSLNMMKDYQRDALRDGMHEAGNIIIAEQKRLISGKSKRLEQAIGHDGVGTYKRLEIFNPVTLEKENRIAYYIRCGYLEDAFETDNDGFNPGVIGLMYEFGRPGKSDISKRQSKTVKQKRKRRKKIPVRSNRKNAKGWKYSEAVPTEVEISKGMIAPVPHIRRGFDNKKEEAAELLFRELENAIERAWNE